MRIAKFQVSRFKKIHMFKNIFASQICPKTPMHDLKKFHWPLKIDNFDFEMLLQLFIFISSKSFHCLQKLCSSPISSRKTPHWPIKIETQNIIFRKIKKYSDYHIKWKTCNIKKNENHIAH